MEDPLNFDVDDGYSIRVPSCWGEAVPEFRHYEGGGVVHEAICLVRTSRRRSDVLRFDAVNYEAAVRLNGEPLGSHEGGYTPFAFGVTDYLQEFYRTGSE